MRIARLFYRWPVKIICIALAIVLHILFRSNTLTERQIAVSLRVLTPEGFVVSSEYPNAINVMLRGDEDELKDILEEDIEAYINLTSYIEEGEYQVPIELRKKGSALQPEALELKSRPRTLTISMEPRTIQSFEIEPNLYGSPSLGYELTQFFVSPSSVTAVGPRSQMAELSTLSTELIDLSGRNDDFSITTRIVLPSAQIDIPGGQIIEFRGVVDESIIIRTLENHEVIILDLSERLQIVNTLPPISLTIQGSQLLVEDTRPQNVTFYLDGSAIQRPGNYILPVEIDIPPGLAVLQILPRELSVVVVNAGE
ncbi:hypothetical protein S1OALGB6SA_230 [Olavius algarvensis spirochete endosymbiont]|uniref:CdaR family protein n=1 Tax=Olavius algarvensis spirochete endosymbiont TaxID=260710 RepID=UPI00052B7D3F|nr:CdaR family protein [Olavius algarvensis spirochete endosymbiont]KGM44145.1 hypothetical protein JY97_02630 [Alkalispirochaeta odontotermitis]VDA99167.1 hypothetical protein S1OALGB6SA_230 [Olavius algarvensis spirochete endosymbiont]